LAAVFSLFTMDSDLIELWYSQHGLGKYSCHFLIGVGIHGQVSGPKPLVTIRMIENISFGGR